MFNAMLGSVNMASAICMLTMSALIASIVILCHTFFVVQFVLLNPQLLQLACKLEAVSM